MSGPDWLAGLRERALAEGIAPATWDRAMAGVAPDLEVVARDLDQPEFTRTTWDYLDRAVSDALRAIDQLSVLFTQIRAECEFPS